MTLAIGLDLSLTSPGICTIPLDWDCDMQNVRVDHIDLSKLNAKTDYDRALRLRVASNWIARKTSRITGEIDCAIESLPTRGAFAIAPLAELHGVVRLHLLDELVETRTANQTSARVLFMGGMPKMADGSRLKKGELKRVVRETVQSLPGCANWTGDECDAFVVANWLLCELGAPFMTAGSAK